MSGSTDGSNNPRGDHLEWKMGFCPRGQNLKDLAYISHGCLYLVHIYCHNILIIRKLFRTQGIDCTADWRPQAAWIVPLNSSPQSGDYRQCHRGIAYHWSCSSVCSWAAQPLASSNVVWTTPVTPWPAGDLQLSWVPGSLACADSTTVQELGRRNRSSTNPPGQRDRNLPHSSPDLLRRSHSPGLFPHSTGLLVPLGHGLHLARAPDT